MDSRNGDISLRKASRLFSATGDEKQTDRILELDQNRTAKAEGATVGPWSVWSACPSRKPVLISIVGNDQLSMSPSFANRRIHYSLRLGLGASWSIIDGELIELMISFTSSGRGGLKMASGSKWTALSFSGPAEEKAFRRLSRRCMSKLLTIHRFLRLLLHPHRWTLSTYSPSQWVDANTAGCLFLIYYIATTSE